MDSNLYLCLASLCADLGFMNLSSGPKFTELLWQEIVLNHYLLLKATMNMIPATNGTCDVVFWLVTVFW